MSHLPFPSRRFLVTETTGNTNNTTEGTASWEPGPHNRPIAYWLFACCAMVFGMVVLGGITRLTESGLSIVDWKPVTGAIPPLTEEDWEEEFAKYRQFPEFQLQNPNMTLARFKQIFFWEWFHRLWGRALGAVFAVPFWYFALRGRIPRHLYPHLGAMMALGALQGGLGWFMVKSGLEPPDDDQRRPVSVSPYRLTAHLALAFAIYAYMQWVGMGLLRGPMTLAPEALKHLGAIRRLAHGALHLAGITVLSGAFVAGSDAGYVYNEFPFMGERIVPAEYWDETLKPKIRNFFENVATVQFNHRVLGTATLSLVAALWARSRGVPLPLNIQLALNTALGLSSVQVALGITALLTAVPVTWGAAHQAGALSLYTSLLWLMHLLRTPRNAAVLRAMRAASTKF